MYLCGYVSKYAYIYVRMHECMYAQYICACMQVSVLCMSVCTHDIMCVCLFMHISNFISIYIYM